MLKSQMELPVTALSAAARRIPLVALLLILLMTAGCAFVLVHRHETRRGIGAQVAPAVGRVAEPEPQGRLEAAITYTCIDKAGDGEVTDTFVWDDARLTSTDGAYDAELARTSALISTLAYSESGYYQAGSTQPAYMEEALHAFGFDEVDTSSYRYRSEVVDQVLNLVTRQEDGAAYTIARKRVVAPDGGQTAIIVMAARGSYGSEWLSNLKLAIDEARVSSALDSAAAQEDARRDASTADAVSRDETAASSTRDDAAHPGYVDAAAEIGDELGRWVSESHAAGDRVVLLTCGHSRGGAIANLVAAQAIDAQRDAAAAGTGAAGSVLAPDDKVVAYTFAAPASTTARDARDARYASIHNIINPSDIMPHVPLATWGYTRFGSDIELPAWGEEGFEASFARMERRFKEVMGTEVSYEPADADVVDTVIDEVGERITSVDALMTPAGVADALMTLALHVDPARMLAGHLPSVYLAWMSALA